MRIAILAAILLQACCASNQPLVAPAQYESVKADYQAAAAAESRYRNLPPCVGAWQLVCFDAGHAERIRIAEYNAAAALVGFDQERTAGAMAKAREQVARFTAAANGE